MKYGPKPRGASSGMKGRNKVDQENILLARGISARYCGANTPLTSLSSEDIEKDLRHMEAYSNACTTYAQQFYRYQKEMRGGGAGEKESANKPAVQPLIAMPVRIDPEEEKRLINLRQKIQQCESQREVLESEYLSLRAHYVYLSQTLKTSRTEVNDRVEFLKAQVHKRGKLVALQRARVQIAREVFAALNYRLSAEIEGAGTSTNPEGSDSSAAVNDKEADLVELWVSIEEQFKKAEQECRSDGTQKWKALKIPPIPPGIPLLLSPLAKGPGNAAAWAASGMFGSNPDSLVWLENMLPAEVPTRRNQDLPALREQVEILQRELESERQLNTDLQSTIIKRRKSNNELIAMMTLLRTETEAVIARHNILLDSDIARYAAERLVDEEELQQKKKAADAAAANPHQPVAGVDGAGNTLSPITGKDVSAPKGGEIVPASGEGDNTASQIPATSKAEDNANDGDDEGEVGDDDDDEEGEIVEEQEGDGAKSASAPKRNFDDRQQDENGGSPRDRAKRRKL